MHILFMNVSFISVVLAPCLVSMIKSNDDTADLES